MISCIYIVPPKLYKNYTENASLSFICTFTDGLPEFFVFQIFPGYAYSFKNYLSNPDCYSLENTAKTYTFLLQYLNGLVYPFKKRIDVNLVS